jgi:drug/metabolite transporter (DMT)-like permease
LVFVSFAAGIPRPAVAGSRTVLIWLAVMLVAATLAWWPGSGFMRPGAGLGVAAGLCYAAGDVSTKGAVSGVGLFLIPVLIVCHVLGFVAMQLAFQRGSALATAGTSTLLNNALPIIAGIFAFHERLPAAPFGVVRAAGFVMVVVGAALLAKPERPSSETPGGSPAVVTSEKPPR